MRHWGIAERDLATPPKEECLSVNEAEPPTKWWGANYLAACRKLISDIHALTTHLMTDLRCYEPSSLCR